MTTPAHELIAAGRAAMERNDWSEAYALLSKAAAADELDPGGFEDLARAAWWSGQPDSCLDARERAYAGHVKSGDPGRAALVALDLADGYFHKKAEAVGFGWVRRAARLLESEPRSVEHGYLARSQAVVAFEAKSDLDEALELARAAYEIGAEFADRDLQALTLHDQGRIMVARGQVEEGMALMDEAMVAAVGGELGALYTGKIYCNMIDICEQLADYRRAADWSDAATRWCERAGHSSGFPGVCRIHRAEIMRLRGDWASAEEEAERASRELGNFVDFAGEALYEIGEIRLHMGDHERAEEAFKQAHGLGRDPVPGMAELHLARGNAEGARVLVGQSLQATMAPLKRARLLPTAVDVALAVGDHDTARSAVDELGAIADEYGSPALLAHAAHGKGAVLIADGDASAAVASLRRAADLWRENDFPYLAAKARMLLARAHRMQGSEDLAGMEYGAALKAFEDLGAMADVRAARRALQTPARADGGGERTTTTLMFTDIVDSTPLVGVIGDDAWEQLLAWHNRTLRSLFAGKGGREVEYTGDGFLVAFERAQAAADSAVEIQQTLAQQRREHGFAPEVRIGLHVGEVTEMDGSLAGEEVHKAARICSAAAGGEILASADVAGLIGVMVGEVQTIDVKGFAAGVDVVSLPWA